MLASLTLSTPRKISLSRRLPRLSGTKICTACTSKLNMPIALMLPAVRLSTMKQSRLLKRNSTFQPRAPNLRKQGSFTIYSSSFGGQSTRPTISLKRNLWANLCSFSISLKRLLDGNNCSRRGRKGHQQ